MASEPAKVVGLTTGALRKAVPVQDMACGTQIYPNPPTLLSFRFIYSIRIVHLIIVQVIQQSCSGYQSTDKCSVKVVVFDRKIRQYRQLGIGQNVSLSQVTVNVWKDSSLPARKPRVAYVANRKKTKQNIRKQEIL